MKKIIFILSFSSICILTKAEPLILVRNAIQLGRIIHTNYLEKDALQGFLGFDTLFFSNGMALEILPVIPGDSSRSVPFFKNRTADGKNKLIAAILACPFPFGILGLHRIYLGTKPIVPVVYIATFGGCLGILPFIDFIVIILDKEISSYQDNGKIFMWVR